MHLASNVSCVNWNAYYNNCVGIYRNPFQVSTVTFRSGPGLRYDTVFQGSVSFDNIGFAWVAIFLVISLEGWTDIMYYVQDAHSFWNWIYFVLLIVVSCKPGNVCSSKR